MNKNQMFLKKAQMLLPELIKTPVEVAQTVTMQPQENELPQIEKAEDYRQKSLKKGDRVILDFGNHQVGYFSMQLGYEGSHPDAPVWLRLHFAEHPTELFESAKEYQGWICSSWIEEEQIHVDVIPSEVRLSRRYAFRYVEIEVLDISSKFDLKIEHAFCEAVSAADDNQLCPYKSDSSLWEKLDQVACRTLHNCMQTVFEDGPKRDRRLWMGDLRMQALANYQTYKKNDMVKACLYLFAGLPMEGGQMGACVFTEPEYEVDDTVMYDYSLFFVNILFDYYLETKDQETLRELWPTALSQIYIAEKQIGENGIVEDSDQLGWCFVDWKLDLNKQASAQGIFLYTLKAAIEIAGYLEEEIEQHRLQELYQISKAAANEILWDEDFECFVSGKDKQISYASQVWMILGGAIEPQEGKRLLDSMEHKKNVAEMVTPYMYHNYIEALIQCGNEEKAFEQLETYWGGMIEQKADTFWELYNPQNPSESPYGGTIVNSYCHAWSCAPAYFLRKYKK